MSDGGPLNRVPSFEEDGRELFEAACQLDLEGIVAKRKADPYGPLGQLTKEELGRLELAERLVASPGFQFDLSEEAARQAISADLRSVRERVPGGKGKRG